MTYRVAIIGLGAIGCGYDLKFDSTKILSHAHAFLCHSKFKLVAGCDVNLERCKIFQARYNLAVYTDSQQLFEAENLDLVVIATPTSTHLSVFKEIQAYQPKWILFEKPFGQNTYEATYMHEWALKHERQICVNYMRRFEPGVQALKKKWEVGHWGALNKVIIYFSGDLRCNASHYIDLLMFLHFSQAHEPIIQEIHSIDNENYFFKLNDVSCFLIKITSPMYSMGEMHCYFEAGKVSYLENGAKILDQSIQSNDNFPGYFKLSESEDIENDFYRYQWYVVDALAKAMQLDKEPLSSARTALSTARILDQLHKNLQLKTTLRDFQYA